MPICGSLFDPAHREPLTASAHYWNRRSFPKWKGVEDVLFLNLDRTGHAAQPRVAVTGETLTNLVVLTAPNADAAATRQQADALVAAHCDPPRQAMAVLMPEALVVAHFTPAAASVRVSVSLPDREIPLLPGTQTVTTEQEAPVAGCTVHYVVDIGGRPVPTTSMLRPVARLTADTGALDLCIDVPNRRRLLITNRSSRATACTLRAVDTERSRRFDLAPRQTLPVDLLMLSG